MPDRIIYHAVVQPEWLDYNGHMNDAYYAVVFSKALDALMSKVGMDVSYRDKTFNSLFTLQAQICYLKEALLDESMYVDFQILGFDRKRLHVFFNLYRQTDDELLATSEQMLLNIDMKVRRSTNFDEFIGQKITAIWQSQSDLTRPRHAGRTYVGPSNHL